MCLTIFLDSGCPGGGASGGSCIGGQCGSGFACNSNNVCCAQVVPATVCPDGTQAAGNLVGFTEFLILEFQEPV